MALDDTTSGAPPAVPPELTRTLDTLEDLVDRPRQVAGHAVSIPVADFHALMARLRDGLPRAIVQSEEIARAAEDAMDRARREADAIVNEARQETERVQSAARQSAAGLVEESPEVRFANAQRADILKQAQQAALNARQDVDQYARETLDRLEQYVHGVQHQVRSGLVALAREREREQKRETPPRP